MLKFSWKIFVIFSLHFLTFFIYYSNTKTATGSFKLPYKRQRFDKKNDTSQAMTMRKIKYLLIQQKNYYQNIEKKNLTKRMTNEYETPLIDSYNTIFTTTVTIGEEGKVFFGKFLSQFPYIFYYIYYILAYICMTT